VHVSLEAPRGPLHLLVLLSDPNAVLRGEADGAPLQSGRPEGEVRRLEGGRATGRPVTLDLHASSGGILGLWLAGVEPGLTGRLD
jgi:hypothetical protein